MNLSIPRSNYCLPNFRIADISLMKLTIFFTILQNMAAMLMFINTQNTAHKYIHIL